MVMRSGLNGSLIGFRSGKATLHGWPMVLLSIGVSALLTGIFALSGLDWAYFVVIQHLSLFGPPMAAAGFGCLFPGLLCGSLFLAALMAPRKGFGAAGVAVLISTALALAVSTALKSIAGRVSPPHHDFGADLADADISGAFNFGLMNESIPGGWPSSHATGAFAVAISVMVALPAARGLRLICLALAAFIGIGVTFGFHWLSEFLSGAMIGASIGHWMAVQRLRTGLRSNARQMAPRHTFPHSTVIRLHVGKS